MSQVKAFIAGLVFIGLGIFLGDPVPQEFRVNAAESEAIAEDAHKEAGFIPTGEPMYTGSALSACPTTSEKSMSRCL